MTSAVMVALLLSQTNYVRSRVNDSDSRSHCLWWKENTNIVFHQSTKGLDEVALDGEFTAVTKASQSWQAALSTCASLNLSEGARTSSRLVTFDETGTNENVILFRTKRCVDLVPTGDSCFTTGECANKYDCWNHATGAIGITTTTYSPKTGQISDSDMEFNAAKSPAGVGFIFTVVDSPACPSGTGSQSCVATDLQNAATHEFGHLMGLAHIARADSTMEASARAGELTKRVIDPGSKQFLCDAYPAAGYTRDCVIDVTTGTLGKAAGCGCQSIDGLAVLALGLLRGLRRRR